MLPLRVELGHLLEEDADGLDGLRCGLLGAQPREKDTAARLCGRARVSVTYSTLTGLNVCTIGHRLDTV